MDALVLRKFIFLLLIVMILEFHCLESSRIGHYRCAWHSGPAPSKSEHITTVATHKQDQSKCTNDDTSRLTSYVNHCTMQNYVPLLACGEDGTWNCQSFIAMCKTLIHTETMSAMRHEPSPTLNPHKQDTDLYQTGDQKDSLPKTEPDEHPRMFSPDENYFTMKEMAVAVLVSFITGATVLAVVICVVWRCRHSHLNSEQVREAAFRSAKRLAAIHAITHIAHAIGGGQESFSSSTISNPQYDQIITSRDILDDALSEHDRVYEEIFARRKSSCKSSDCIYANVNKVKKNSSVIRPNRSVGDLRRIDESAEESDVGYEADSNATPQNPRRPINNFGNIVSKSPAMNATRLNNDFLRKPISFRNCINNTSNYVEVGIGDEFNKDEVSKCDSGYHEELSETGLETIPIGDNKTDNSDVQSPVETRERKQSLRL